MGFFSNIFGQAMGLPPSNQENDSDVPPSRRQPPDKGEKERIRKHYEKEQEKQTPDERDRSQEPGPPKDGRLW